MAKIIKFPLRAEKNHGGASKKGQPPPNADKAKIIDLRPVTEEELEQLLDAVESNPAHAPIGRVLLTSKEVGEFFQKSIGKRRPKRRSKRRASRPQRASGTS